MRELNVSEIDQVNGAAEITIDLGFVKVKFNDQEGASVYRAAVEGMTDFFMWWDPEELLCTGS